MSIPLLLVSPDLFETFVMGKDSEVGTKDYRHALVAFRLIRSSLIKQGAAQLGVLGDMADWRIITGMINDGTVGKRGVQP